MLWWFPWCHKRRFKELRSNNSDSTFSHGDVAVCVRVGVAGRAYARHCWQQQLDAIAVWPLSGETWCHSIKRSACACEIFSWAVCVQLRASPLSARCAYQRGVCGIFSGLTLASTSCFGKTLSYIATGPEGHCVYGRVNVQMAAFICIFKRLGWNKCIFLLCQSSLCDLISCGSRRGMMSPSARVNNPAAQQELLFSSHLQQVKKCAVTHGHWIGFPACLLFPFPSPRSSPFCLLYSIIKASCARNSSSKRFLPSLRGREIQTWLLSREDGYSEKWTGTLLF